MCANSSVSEEHVSSYYVVGYVIVTGLSGAFAQSGQSETGIAVIPFLFVFLAGYDLAM